MKTKIAIALFAVLTLTTLPHPMQAQKKHFTLEDLNYGGNNYRQACCHRTCGSPGGASN